MRNLVRLGLGVLLMAAALTARAQDALAFTARPEACHAAYEAAYADLGAARRNASPLETSLIGRLRREVSDAIDAAPATAAVCDQGTLQSLHTLVEGYRARGLILSDADQAKHDAEHHAAELRRAIADAAQQSARVVRMTTPRRLDGIPATSPYSAPGAPEGSPARQ